LNLSRVCAIICSCRYLGKWFRFPKSITACTESRYPPTKWVQFSINVHLLLPTCTYCCPAKCFVNISLAFVLTVNSTRWNPI
jgi:hypothetical protein